MAELLSESITTKVTEEDLTRFEAAAKAEGLNVSEWARTILLRVVPPPSEVKLLAELLFIRRVLVNGPATGKVLTAEVLRTLDAVKERDARLLFAGKPVPVGENP